MPWIRTALRYQIFEGANERGYKPQVTPEEFMMFIASAYTGIEKYCILGACYGAGDKKTKIEPRKIFRTFAKTMILLAGGKTDD